MKEHPERAMYYGLSIKLMAYAVMTTVLVQRACYVA